MIHKTAKINAIVHLAVTPRDIVISEDIICEGGKEDVRVREEKR